MRKKTACIYIHTYTLYFDDYIQAAKERKQRKTTVFVTSGALTFILLVLQTTYQQGSQHLFWSNLLIGSI